MGHPAQSLSTVLLAAVLAGCATTPDKTMVGGGMETATAEAVENSTFLTPATVPGGRAAARTGTDSDEEEDATGLGLILAARYGHERAVRYLLNQGLDIDQQDDLGHTALTAVAATSHSDILRLLLKEGADVNLATNDGTTALMNAAANGRLENVQLLIQAGADVDQRDQQGNTALVYAIKLGHASIVDQLLAAGADPNLYTQEEVKTQDRLTPLMVAAEYGGVNDGDPAIVRSLIEHGADPRVVRNDGETALGIALRKGYRRIAAFLHRQGARDEGPYASLSAEDALLKAIGLGDVDKARALLDTAADPNYRDTLTGITPLLAAAYHGNGEIVRLLLDHGADIDNVPWGLPEARINASSVPVQQRDLMRAASRGDTALITAIRRRHVDVALQLLAAGADPLQPNRLVEAPGLFAARLGEADVMRGLLKNGLDPDQAQSGQLLDYFRAHIVEREKLRPLLVEAALHGHRDTVAALLEAGANPDLRDPAGRTALFWAASQGFSQVVELLLEHKADPDIRDGQGTTALMSAAKSGFKRVVASLLAHGADVNALETTGSGLEEAGSGMTALAYAARGGHGEIVHMLLAHGADARLRNKAGETPLDLARKNGYEDIARQLGGQLAASPF
ncbi:MAG TPA: hypothetical protein ENK48_05635 [Gammaproteobacteria bacterium]|nr:hypothetical protein [Gammaproteobacteria bacterium]